MSRDNNRETMPIIAGLVDNFREIFGDVKVTYAAENGRELGKQDKEPGLSVGDMVLTPAKHRGQAAADRLRTDALMALKSRED